MLSRTTATVARRLPTRSFAVSRNFKSAASQKSGSTAEKSGGILWADNNAWSSKAIHITALTLAALVPVAIVASPSKLNAPVDLALGLAIPVHAHIGCNVIISDYCPKSLRPAMRGSLLGLTALTTLGLLRLNVEGPGVTETVKALWRKNDKEDK